MWQKSDTSWKNGRTAGHVISLSVSNFLVLQEVWNLKRGRTFMNSKVVPNTVTRAVAVVQAHLPQCPAAQHLHVCTYTKENYRSNILQQELVQMNQIHERMVSMAYILGWFWTLIKFNFEHSWMSVSHLWSLKEIWFEIFQCFPSALWWRPPKGPDMQIQTDVIRTAQKRMV